MKKMYVDRAFVKNIVDRPLLCDNIILELLKSLKKVAIIC
jgi:hypothetical protein